MPAECVCVCGCPVARSCSLNKYVTQPPYEVVTNNIPILQVRILKDKGLIAKGHLVNKRGCWSQTQVVPRLQCVRFYQLLWIVCLCNLCRLRSHFKSHLPCWCSTSRTQWFSFSGTSLLSIGSLCHNLYPVLFWITLSYPQTIPCPQIFPT